MPDKFQFLWGQKNLLRIIAEKCKILCQWSTKSSSEKSRKIIIKFHKQINKPDKSKQLLNSLRDWMNGHSSLVEVGIPQPDGSWQISNSIWLLIIVFPLTIAQNVIFVRKSMNVLLWMTNRLLWKRTINSIYMTPSTNSLSTPTPSNLPGTITMDTTTKSNSRKRAAKPPDLRF